MSLRKLLVLLLATMLVKGGPNIVPGCIERKEFEKMYKLSSDSSIFEYQNKQSEKLEHFKYFVVAELEKNDSSSNAQKKKSR